MILLALALFITSCKDDDIKFGRDGLYDANSPCDKEGKQKILKCGVNNNGEQLMICTNGEWIAGECKDADAKPQNDDDKDVFSQPDSDFGYDKEPDIDIDDNDTPVCGNNKLETGETCEKGNTKSCTAISSSYESGTATCKSDCLGWDETSCKKKDMFPNEHDGLYWSDKSTNKMNWEDTIIYCTDLGGRLPTIDELRTLIINCPESMTGGSCQISDPDHLESSDYSESCYCDGSAASYSALSDDKNTWLWSSSSHGDMTDAWGVDFGYGDVGSSSKPRYRNVRCVNELPVCGNSKLETGETCETGETMDCTLINGDYTSGTASCKSDCSGWDESGCVAKPSSSFVLCTGLTKCYNNSSEITCPSEGEDFYGQDAQYSDFCTPKNFTANSETVTDNNTGLIWQRNIPTTYYGCTGGDPTGSTCTWQEAINYCENLTLAGSSNWRLPNIEELETLIDYGRENQTINPIIFPYTLQSWWLWSSSFYINDISAAWNIYVNSGSTSYLKKIYNKHVKCVSGSEYKPKGTFIEEIKSGKVIVTDTKTKLQWTKEYSIDKTWQQALSYCETLDYGGYTDWRLPNINELKTLRNRTKHNPASDFPEMPSNYFWSSSSLMPNTISAWGVRFIDGLVGDDVKTDYDYPNYVICIR